MDETTPPPAKTPPYTLEPGRIVHLRGVEIFRIARRPESAISPSVADAAARHIVDLFNELNVRIYNDGTVFDDRLHPADDDVPTTKAAKEFYRKLRIVRECPEEAAKAMARAEWHVQRALLLIRVPMRTHDILAHLEPVLKEAEFELSKMFDESVEPSDRVCEREGCGKKLDPRWPAVYCSNDCAFKDA